MLDSECAETLENFVQSLNESSDLNDSLFQVPIRRLPTRLDANDEGFEFVQDEYLEQDNISPDTHSEAGSWENVLTPSAESCDEEENASGIIHHHAEAVGQPREPVTIDLDGFCEAVSAGYIELIKILSDPAIHINRENSDGFTPLVLALKARQVEMTRYLLKIGANAHHKVHCFPPIIYAIQGKTQAPQLIQPLLNAGVNPSIPFDGFQHNALHYAASMGIVDAVEFLVSKYMTIDEVTAQQQTPLILAAEQGHLRVVKILVAKGANIHASTSTGGNALIGAAYGGHVEVVRYLLDQGMDLDINARNDRGHSALIAAAYGGHVEVVRCLLDRGIDLDINAGSGRGYSALICFIKRGHLEGVQLLLSRGADVDISFEATWNLVPVMVAAKYGYKEIVETLIEHGANNNTVNGTKTAILDAAFAGKHAGTIRATLKALGGAEYPLQSVALNLAMSSSHVSTKSIMDTSSIMFSEFGSKVTGAENTTWLGWVLENGGSLVKPYALDAMMDLALHEGDIDLVATLLLQGYNPDQRLANGNTLLGFAVDNHDADLISVLLEGGADPNIETRQPGKPQRTPLHQALVLLERDLHKDTSVVDRLLNDKRRKLMKGYHLKSTAFYYFLETWSNWEHGSAEVLMFRMLHSLQDPHDDRADDGTTLMHAAAAKGRLDLVDVLLTLGADINTIDREGCTPLFFCPLREDILQAMVERGANALAINHSNYTILHRAAVYDSMDDIDYLLDLGADIELISHFGFTPLILAALYGQEDTALHLLDRGANATVQWQNTKGNLLHIAASTGLPKLAERLIKDESVDLNAQDLHGWTPLAVACKNKNSADIGLQLILAGADIEISIDTGNRPLHIALLHQNDLMAEMLLHHGAKPFVPDAEKSYALHHAVACQFVSVAEHLLEIAEDVDIRDSNGETALFYSSDARTTSLLIEHGATVNITDDDGWTPLHKAVLEGNLPKFEVLLEAGADLEARVYNGTTSKKDWLSVKERIENLEDPALRDEFCSTVSRAGKNFWKEHRGEERQG